jgi:hypothetical protein
MHSTIAAMPINVSCAVLCARFFDE